MSKKILIIDDDQTNIKIIQPILENDGFIVFAAYNGEEGLSLVESQRPDLIILDVEMPKMNGYTFMMELGKKEALKNTPVIVLTSHEEHQPIFKLRGVKGYLIKPLDPEHLLGKVKEFFE